MSYYNNQANNYNRGYGYTPNQNPQSYGYQAQNAQTNMQTQNNINNFGSFPGQGMNQQNSYQNQSTNNAGFSIYRQNQTGHTGNQNSTFGAQNSSLYRTNNTNTSNYNDNAVSSVTSVSKRRNVIGSVTKIHDKFCFIDSDIFCQLSLFRSSPRVGDKYAVDAEFNPQMPFKWNATRVSAVSNPSKPAYTNHSSSNYATNYYAKSATNNTNESSTSYTSAQTAVANSNTSYYSNRDNKDSSTRQNKYDRNDRSSNESRSHQSRDYSSNSNDNRKRSANNDYNRTSGYSNRSSSYNSYNDSSNRDRHRTNDAHSAASSRDRNASHNRNPKANFITFPVKSTEFLDVAETTRRYKNKLTIPNTFLKTNIPIFESFKNSKFINQVAPDEILSSYTPRTGDMFSEFKTQSTEQQPTDANDKINVHCLIFTGPGHKKLLDTCGLFDSRSKSRINKYNKPVSRTLNVIVEADKNSDRNYFLPGGCHSISQNGGRTKTNFN